jgi:dihydroxyacetone kinase
VQPTQQLAVEAATWQHLERGAAHTVDPPGAAAAATAEGISEGECSRVTDAATRQHLERGAANTVDPPGAAAAATQKKQVLHSNGSCQLAAPSKG